MVSAVLPAYAAVSIATDYKEKSELAAFYGEDAKILICTSEGFKYISIAELESGNESHSGKVNCKLCLQGKIKDTAINPKLVFVSFTEPLSEIAASYIEAEEAISLAEKGGNQTRAPPNKS